MVKLWSSALLGKKKQDGQQEVVNIEEFILEKINFINKLLLFTNLTMIIYQLDNLYFHFNYNYHLNYKEVLIIFMELLQVQLIRLKQKLYQQHLKLQASKINNK